VSGLETAIRNALDRSERGDGEVRARIYQSARQALDAGLRKQGVTDNLVIMQQRKRLEDKIREIEVEEINRLAEVATPPLAGHAGHDGAQAATVGGAGSEPRRQSQPDARPGAGPAPAAEPIVAVDPARQSFTRSEPAEAVTLGGVTRSNVAEQHATAPSVDVGDRQAPSQDSADTVQAPMKTKGRRGARKSEAGLGLSSERAAKPRRKRSLLSRLVTWIVTLGVVAVGCWIFYQSGMVQSIIDEAMRSANRPGAAQSSQGPSALTSRGGFSEEWAEIFEPTEGAVFSPGPRAQAQLATGSDGQALRVTSGSPGDDGDVAIEVPAEILRELAGKSSTLAITIQSAANQASQLSVRCDFGSLGTCARHRFSATQERLDALFRVSFDQTMVPNAPGRLIVNSGVQGADRPVLIYSVRALPGQ
jgi:hypothetical protein